MNAIAMTLDKPPAAAPAPPRHETLQEMHGVLVVGIITRFGLKPGDAAAWADAIVEALQDHYGGLRIGRSGVYIPARNKRAGRDDRIRELMGPPPHTRKRVREVATKEGVSIATVWRVLGQTPPLSNLP